MNNGFLGIDGLLRKPARGLALATLVLVTAGTALVIAQEEPLSQEVAPPVAQDSDGTPAPTPDDQPLEDYEASEQISEDLSVSFPVDI